jgi:site-specific recombinase XerC
MLRPPKRVISRRRVPIVAGKPHPSDVRLIADYVAKEYVKTRGDRPTHYLTAYLDVLVPAANGEQIRIGAKPMDDILTRDIRTAEATRAKRGPNAVRHLLQSARHFHGWAIKHEYARHDPFRNEQGKVLISVGKSSQRSRRLEAGEYERIIEKGGPVRQGLPRVHAVQRVPARRVAHAAMGAGHGYPNHHPGREVEDAEGTHPYPSEVKEVLDRRRKGPDGDNLPDDAYVFGTETGEQIARKTLCERWRTACDAAGVVNLHLHDLRAEFGSRLADAGVPLHLIRDSLGHSNVQITSTYLRTRVDSLEGAFDALSASPKLKLVVNK